MRAAKILYAASRYQSHLRVAAIYRELIQSRYETASTPDDADIVVLHKEPHDYPAIYERYPELAKKYVIAYCVWEATELPETYKRSVELVQEVWSCSRYSCAVFQKDHSRVIYMPHVIERDTACSGEDLAFIRDLIRHSAQNKYYLTITKLWDKRKNTDALIKTFESVARTMPGAYLIIKASPSDNIPPVHHPRVVYIARQLSQSQLNALYRLSDVYVSAHHSEGWGLPLSDAMLFRKPVVATGYSGNLEFMNLENSFLLGFTERRILSQDCFGRFTAEMRWAYPDERDLAETLVFLDKNLNTGPVNKKIRRASQDILRFRRTEVEPILHQRIAEIVRHEL